jgi:hypothetical protein
VREGEVVPVCRALSVKHLWSHTSQTACDRCEQVQRDKNAKVGDDNAMSDDGSLVRKRMFSGPSNRHTFIRYPRLAGTSQRRVLEIAVKFSFSFWHVR